MPIDAFDPTDDREPTPEQVALSRASQRMVRRAIARLTPPHREALTLFFVHDLSYAEMADVLGVPTGTVKSRLSHAKRALAAMLAGTVEGDHV